MANGNGTETYRFICTYYRIPREIEDRPDEWRGWIALVPDSPEKILSEPPSRVWFRGIDDLPRALRRALEGAE